MQWFIRKNFTFRSQKNRPFKTHDLGRNLTAGLIIVVYRLDWNFHYFSDIVLITV